MDAFRLFSPRWLHHFERWSNTNLINSSSLHKSFHQPSWKLEWKKNWEKKTHYANIVLDKKREVNYFIYYPTPTLINIKHFEQNVYSHFCRTLFIRFSLFHHCRIFFFVSFFFVLKHTNFNQFTVCLKLFKWESWLKLMASSANEGRIRRWKKNARISRVRKSR